MRSLWLFSLLMMMLIYNTYARSLITRKIPDTSKKGLPTNVIPAAVAPYIRTHFFPRDQGDLRDHGQRNSLKNGLTLSMIRESPTNANSESRKQVAALPVIKFNTSSMKKDNLKKNSVVPSQTKGSHKKNIIIPGQIKHLFHKLPTVDENNTGGTTTVLAMTVITTTEDPWEEFCKEACEEGLAGPECDCAEHPIGRRHAPLPESPVSTTREDSIKELSTQIKPRGLSEMSGNKSTFLKPTNGNNEGASGTETSQTTEDPLEVFCQVACKEGQGSVACDCRDHIIG